MAEKTASRVKKENGSTEENKDVIINTKLADVNALISPYQLAWVDPVEDCELLEHNARYMTKEQLGRLTENVKGDGFLSQLPFCIKEESGKFKVLSGNHRVKSAIKAGLSRILVLFGTVDAFDEQKQLAIQLSHNAISGQDDISILQELYASLKDLDLKAYTGIDEKELFKYHSLDFSGISEQDIALNPVNLMFCDVNKEYTEKVFDKLNESGLDPEKDALVVGSIDRFVEIMTKCKQWLNIKNRSVAVLAMCRICEAWLEAQGGEEEPSANPAQ